MDIDYSNRGYGAGIIPSVTYFASENWAVSASLGKLYYNRSANTETDSDSEITIIRNNYGIDLDSSTFSFSLSYFIR
jgi:hypothetical protein